MNCSLSDFFVPNNPHNLLTCSMGGVLLEKLTGFQLVKISPTIYGTRRFITTFTSTSHLSLSWTSSIQSVPVLILPCHLCLCLPSCLFPSGFPAKTICTPLLFPIHTTCLAHLILLDVIAQIVFCEKYGLWCQSLCAFLHFPVTSSLLGPNIFLNTLFSNTLTLCSFLHMSAQVAHPY